MLSSYFFQACTAAFSRSLTADWASFLTNEGITISSTCSWLMNYHRPSEPRTMNLFSILVENPYILLPSDAKSRARRSLPLWRRHNHQRIESLLGPGYFATSPKPDRAPFAPHPHHDTGKLCPHSSLCESLLFYLPPCDLLKVLYISIILPALDFS